MDGDGCRAALPAAATLDFVSPALKLPQHLFGDALVEQQQISVDRMVVETRDEVASLEARGLDRPFVDSRRTAW